MGLFSSVLPSALTGIPIVGGSISDLVGKAVADAFFNEMGKVVESAVGSFVNDVLGSVVRSTTSVSAAEGNTWFAGVAKLMLPIVQFVVAPLLMAATLAAVLRQDARRLGRAWGVGLPICALGGYAAVKLADVGLLATDGLSKAMVKDIAPNMKSDFVHALSLGLTSGLAGVVGAVLSVVVLAGGLLIWLELAVRALAVEISVFFMPLALAGVVWPATAHWAKRLVEVLVALLLAKPVVAGALCLGTATLSSSRGSLGSVVSGAAILLLAGFAPLVLFKMAPLVEAQSLAHLQDLSRQPVRAVERAVERVLAVTTGAGATAAMAAGAGEDMSLAGALLVQASGGAAGGGGAGADGAGEGHPLGPARPPGAGGPGERGGAGAGGGGGDG